ncbi:MAG: 2-succinyl-5-enolpyruvyl-6-hydroxy-3-cyclohexene-1-carboxylic-acid synthase [Candidatus Nanopelagicales bacterium]
MNPSTRQARAMVRGFIEAGIEHIVLAPGSRSGALSIAFAQASDYITLHTRFDERSAGFMALGIAKRTNTPVVVLSTSGTATAHFLAPAIEAHESGTPLIILTADRPPVVRGRGSNQTIDQVGLYSAFVRGEWDLPVAENHDDAYWQLAVRTAVQASLGTENIASGPVHINAPFSEPLVPEILDTTWLETLNIEKVTSPQSEQEDLKELLLELGALESLSKAVIITSSVQDSFELATLAEFLNLPILAEPTSNAFRSPNAISHYSALLKDAELSQTLTPELVITAGRFGLSRQVTALVKNAKHHIAIGRYPLDADPDDKALHINRTPIFQSLTPKDGSWIASWRSASAAYESQSDKFDYRTSMKSVLNTIEPSETVWISPSMTIRIADEVITQYQSGFVLANRGVNGIDGLIASAQGAAVTGKTHLLIGDIAFLHDIGSLALPATEHSPNLRIYVFNNHGGEIFSLLEQGEATYTEVFNKVYGTPEHYDLAALASGFGISAQNVSNIEELEAALQSDVTVIVINL